VVGIEQEILTNCHIIAIVGLSPNSNKASYHVGSYLKEQGYKIIPVNPNEQAILGEVCYPDLSSIPQKVDVVDIFRPSDKVISIVDEAIKIGVRFIWMQEGVINEEAARRARQAGLEVVMNKCMLKEHIHSHYSGIYQ
jgi:uncharacterized protein